jgi:hypothetical protein
VLVGRVVVVAWLCRANSCGVKAAPPAKCREMFRPEGQIL